MPTSTLIWNERWKLAATAVNTVATAAVTAGVLTQFAAVAFDLPIRPAGGRLTTGVAGWLALGLYLHGAAHWVLGRLRE